MEQYLELSQKNAIEAYNQASEENKSFLLNLYGEENILVNYKDRLKGYESACKIKGIEPKKLSDFELFYGDKKTAKRMFSRHKIVTGISVVNEGWIPDYTNTNQPKYEIWVQKTSNGFSSRVNAAYSVDSVGSDMHIETREKAEVIEKIFKQELIDYNVG